MANEQRTVRPQCTGVAVTAGGGKGGGRAGGGGLGLGLGWAGVGAPGDRERGRAAPPAWGRGCGRGEGSRPRGGGQKAGRTAGGLREGAGVCCRGRAKRWTNSWRVSGSGRLPAGRTHLPVPGTHISLFSPRVHLGLLAISVCRWERRSKPCHLLGRWGCGVGGGALGSELNFVPSQSLEQAASRLFFFFHARRFHAADTFCTAALCAREQVAGTSGPGQ